MVRTVFIKVSEFGRLLIHSLFACFVDVSPLPFPKVYLPCLFCLQATRANDAQKAVALMR